MSKKQRKNGTPPKRVGQSFAQKMETYRRTAIEASAHVVRSDARIHTLQRIIATMIAAQGSGEVRLSVFAVREAPPLDIKIIDGDGVTDGVLVITIPSNDIERALLSDVSTRVDTGEKIPSIGIMVQREAGFGRWVAELEALPGVIAYGDSPSGAFHNARDLAESVVADRIKNGEHVPEGVVAELEKRPLSYRVIEEELPSF